MKPAFNVSRIILEREREKFMRFNQICIKSFLNFISHEVLRRMNVPFGLYRLNDIEKIKAVIRCSRINSQK